MALNIELVTTASEFAALHEPWDRLRAEAGLLGPFNGFTWSFEWWRALGDGRSLRVFVARQDSAIVGILPLFEETIGGLRILRFLGSAGGGADHLDVIAPSMTTRAALLEHAVRTLSPDRLQLDDIDDTSPTTATIGAMAADRGRLQLEHGFPCPYLKIDGSWEAFIQTATRRDNLRRREKWLSTQPGFRIDCETSPAAVPPFLARFHRLHGARWSTDGGSQAFPDGRLIRFHERVAERMADEGRLRVWTMWVSREPIAVAYTFDDQDRSLYYQCGFDPVWSGRSAGLVLLARYLEDAFRRGVREVDFLRGAEPYKKDWATHTRQTVRLHWHLTARSRAAVLARRVAESAKASAVSLLPSELRASVTRSIRSRRLRRALPETT